MEIVPDTQPIQPKYGRILLLWTTSPPIWLKISFHFCPFWVPFLSLNHNQAVEIIELFFPLSYPSNIGCTVFKFTFLFTFTKFVYISQQILSIQRAIQAGMTQMSFEDSEIKISVQCAVFVTTESLQVCLLLIRFLFTFIVLCK